MLMVNCYMQVIVRLLPIATTVKCQQILYNEPFHIKPLRMTLFTSQPLKNAVHLKNLFNCSKFELAWVIPGNTQLQS